MARPTARFTGGVAANYERHLVPLIFASYADHLVRRAEAAPGAAVLETACGTGVVTRRLAAALPSGARLTATDFTEAMLDEARRCVGTHTAVAFRQADATALPFDDASFDLLVCQFGVMFFPDKAAGYGEAARVLRPGGRFLFNVWDALAENHLARAVHEIAGTLFPADPPRFLEVPYGYQDLTAITRAVQRAGFAEVEITVLPDVSRAASAGSVALAFAAGTPLAGQLAERGAGPEVLEEIERAIAERYGNGPFAAPMQAFQVIARLPGA